ncbi:hypothetical protein [Polaribacter uvawellassae]|uniref:hypothetical protein n=1 Tax=Polaribacter uvawellassae TaxID=3133495 RepID=UPI003219C4DB
MKKILTTVLITFFTIGLSFAQIKVTGKIYRDTTLTKPFPRVKVILRSENSKKVVRSKRDGNYYIQKKDLEGKVQIEFRKKGYIDIIIDLPKNKSKFEFDIVLRKISGPHSKVHFGMSKVIRRKLN